MNGHQRLIIQCWAEEFTRPVDAYWRWSQLPMFHARLAAYTSDTAATAVQARTTRNHGGTR